MEIRLKAFRKKTKMGTTIVIKCTQCGGLTLTGKIQKTKICPYCGTQIKLIHAQKVAAANTALEASEMLRKLKIEQKQNPKPSKRA